MILFLVLDKGDLDGKGGTRLSETAFYTAMHPYPPPHVAAVSARILLEVGCTQQPYLLATRQ